MTFKNLKPDEFENGTHRRCGQVECVFYKKGGCRNCQGCQAEPYVLKKGCAKCYDCENKEDSLRWGDKEAEKTEIKQKTKQEVEVKVEN